MTNNQPKVMVVDDEPGMRLTLEGIIEDEGYDVIGVSDGYQAIELAGTESFALIFMDIKMPGINGVEAYHEIKRVSPGSVVVMMTGFAVEELVKEALENGAYAVLYKPFAGEQIIEILETVLANDFVLLVEDQAGERQTLQALLEERGYRVGQAQDGPEAIRMAMEQHYHIILMDIRMPGMDGFTAFQEIRKHDSLAKAIFITGYELEDAARKALLAGAYTVVAKPLDPEKLFTLMASVAGQETKG